VESGIFENTTACDDRQVEELDLPHAPSQRMRLRLPTIENAIGWVRSARSKSDPADVLSIASLMFTMLLLWMHVDAEDKELCLLTGRRPIVVMENRGPYQKLPRAYSDCLL